MNQNCTYAAKFIENIDILRPNDENFKFPSKDSIIKEINYYYSPKYKNKQLGSYDNFKINAKQWLKLK